jgi:hypothetical protein
MPYVVNGQLVPEELIREEFLRIGRDPQWQSIADLTERANRLRVAAEQCAQDRLLIEQAAANDPRPIDAASIEQEVQRQKAQWGCRSAFDDNQLRQLTERNLRVQRIRQEMAAGAVKPLTKEVEAFFNANRDSFRRPDLFHASHIVKHVNHEQSEDQAEAGIQVAVAELEQGLPFAEVAARHSDCKDKGGDLGQFPAGHMVEEFEEAIRTLEPGQRTDVFTTPFGFHIAQLHSITAAGPAAFEEVRAGIERVLNFACEHEAYMRAVAELRSRADIHWVSSACQTPEAPVPQATQALGELLRTEEFRRRENGDVFGGWCSIANNRNLERLIAKHNVKTVAEIGSFLGYSAAWFARRVERVICIDTFEELEQQGTNSNLAPILRTLGLPRDFYDVFRRNMIAEGVWETIEVIRGLSSDVADRVPEVDLVYVDGDHTEGGCLADIELYIPKARKLICGNDYSDKFPGVRTATAALLPDHRSEASFWWFEKATKSKPEPEAAANAAD